MSVVLGKDVVIRFMHYGANEYMNYYCAETVTINTTLETKSVKTIGDGFWKKSRGQLLGYQITIDGLIQASLESEDATDIWYAVRRQFSMTEIEFRVVFTDVETGQTKYLDGKALAEDITITAGSEDFAEGSIVLIGNGKLDITDYVAPCIALIGSLSVSTSDIYTDGYFTDIQNTNRIEFSVDGGDRQVIFLPPGVTELNTEVGRNLPAGNHTITAWGVCADGRDGNPYVLPFVIEEGGGVDECPLITNLQLAGVTETTASFTFDEVTPEPNDGYTWEVLKNGVPKKSGVVFDGQIDVEELEEGVTYVLTVRTLCQAGVSESGSVSLEFTTDTDESEIAWSFTITSPNVGNFKIAVSGTNLVNTSSSGSGTFAGSPVEHLISVSGSSGIHKNLFIVDTTVGGPPVADLSQTSNITNYSFTPVAGHSYAISASVGPPV